MTKDVKIRDRFLVLKGEQLYRIVLLIMLSPLLLFSSDYRLGEGIQIADTPLYAGGYFSLNYGDELNGSREFIFDDIAFMLYAQEGSWSFMSEIEMNDVYYNQFELNEDTNSSFEVHAERIYVRYEASDTWRTTLGKFNSPIGFWNLMPINVLRDTTSNPIVTGTIFPRFTTGLDLDLTLSQHHKLILLLQATPDLDTLFHSDNPYNSFDIDRHIALGYSYPFKDLTFKVNGGYFRERDIMESWYYGYLALRYEHTNLKVMGEYGYRQNSEGGEVINSGYLQGVYGLNIRHQLIARVEHVDDEWLNDDRSFWLAGYTYRPFASMALKAEYQRDFSAEWQKLLLSFSVLF